MMRKAALLIAGGLALGLSAEARAFSPEASGHLNYGIGLNVQDGEPNGYGFGFGARGGVSLPASSLYVGGVIDYYFGGSEGPDSNNELSLSTWVFAAEVGYNLSFPSFPVALRPRLGVGLVDVQGEVKSSTFLGTLTASASTSSFAFLPGISATVEISAPLFVGGELTLVVPTENIELSQKSITIGAVVGAKF